MPGGHSLLRLSLTEFTTATQYIGSGNPLTVLNTAARLVVGFSRVAIDVLHWLWLPVPQRIQFKIARLTFASEAPDLPTSIALPVQWRGRPGLCSAELDDLFVSRTRTTDANVAK